MVAEIEEIEFAGGEQVALENELQAVPQRQARPAGPAARPPAICPLQVHLTQGLPALPPRPRTEEDEEEGGGLGGAGGAAPGAGAQPPQQQAAQAQRQQPSYMLDAVEEDPDKELHMFEVDPAKVSFTVGLERFETYKMIVMIDQQGTCTGVHELWWILQSRGRLQPPTWDNAASTSVAAAAAAAVGSAASSVQLLRLPPPAALRRWRRSRSGACQTP